MTTHKLTTIIMFALVAAALTLPVHAQPPKSSSLNTGRYMSQTFVDTTILRAFYVLNATSSQYGTGGDRQRHAIDHAKRILQNLRNEAKGDPNERYALMKIQEVEAQIYLEEEELRNIRAQRNLLESNRIVIQYNGEIANPRPDFRTLRGYFLQMSEVDPRQANRLAESYNRRHRAVSREAQHSLERALNARDYQLASRELEYLEKNRNYLMIASSHLERQRARLNSLSGANTALPQINAALDAGEAAFREFKLSESRNSLTMAQNRIRELRADLQEREANALTTRAARAIRALDAREDSLVRVALNVLDVQGPDAAVEYFQEVLQKRMRLSHERAAIVDQAILAARPDLAPRLGTAIEMVDHEKASQGHESLTLMQDRARFRAQERADSLKAVREQAANISDNIYTLIGQRKTRDADRLFNRERPFLESVFDKKEFDILHRSVQHGANLATPEGDKHRRRAETYMARIYKLIEDNNIHEANKRFRQYRRPLQKHLDSESYKMLEVTVTQAGRQRR